MGPLGDPLLWYAKYRLEELRQEAARERERRRYLAGRKQTAEEAGLVRLIRGLLGLARTGARHRNAAPSGQAGGGLSGACCPVACCEGQAAAR